MKKISLSRGHFALVDDADFEWLNQWKWCSNGYYAVRVENKKTIYMHKLILNPPTGFISDHKNRDKLDNTRGNLRICTASQNQTNREVHPHSITGIKGVSWNPISGKWRALIRKDGRDIRLGHFSSKEEAALAYAKAANRYHGEFACYDVL